MSSLTLRGVGFSFGSLQVLREVSLTLEPGEMVGLLGPNGAGKSTLLQLAAGLRPGFSGEGWVDGESLAPQGAAAVRRRARAVALIPQRPPTGLDLLAGELVLTGLAPQLGGWAGGGPAERHRARGALAATGTAGLAERQLGTLSGGELRRVLLAQAMVREPRLLLLDEPLAALDLGAQGRVLDLVAAASRRGIAALIALHDLNLARRVFKRVVLLLAGAVLADGAPEVVLTAPRIEAAFGPAEADGKFFFPRQVLGASA